MNLEEKLSGSTIIYGQLLKPFDCINCQNRDFEEVILINYFDKDIEKIREIASAHNQEVYEHKLFEDEIKNSQVKLYSMQTIAKDQTDLRIFSSISSRDLINVGGYHCIDRLHKTIVSTSYIYLTMFAEQNRNVFSSETIRDLVLDKFIMPLIQNFENQENFNHYANKFIDFCKQNQATEDGHMLIALLKYDKKNIDTNLIYAYSNKIAAIIEKDDSEIKESIYSINKILGKNNLN